MLTGDFSNDNIHKFVSESAKELSKNYTLVSNFTKGLDEEIIDNLIKNNHIVFCFYNRNVNNIIYKFRPQKYALFLK